MKRVILYLSIFCLFLTGVNPAIAASLQDLLNEYSISDNAAVKDPESAAHGQTPASQQGFILGYYIEPQSTPINKVDFAGMKKIGITDIYVRATTNGNAGVKYTSLPEWKAKADAAGLRIHAWVWDGFYGNYAKAVSDMGINILMDMETYNMGSKLTQLANIRKNTRGKIFTVCAKAEDIDGAQQYSEIIKHCDYISPMLYKGDYNLTLEKMKSYAKRKGEKYPILMSLETYISDRNPVPKSNASILAEIEAVRPYCKGVILFRYGHVSKFSGGVKNLAPTTTKTAQKSGTSSSPTLKQVPESDNTQDKKLVAALQSALQSQGFYTGRPVDGWFGPQTEDAVRAYQKYNGLAVTGTADAALQKRLAAGPSVTLREVPENDTTQDKNLVKELQKALQKKGYYAGLKIDGWFGPDTRDAVKAFQRDHGLEASGIADGECCKRLTSQ